MLFVLSDFELPLLPSIYVLLFGSLLRSNHLPVTLGHATQLWPALTTERRETYQSLRAVFGLSQRRGLESGSDWLRFSRLRNSQQETIDKWETIPRDGLLLLSFRP